MPSYERLLQLLGPDTSISIEEYLCAQQLALAKARGHEEDAEAFLPYIIQDLIFRKWCRGEL